MYFELTGEQKEIVKSARKFAESNFPDVAREYDREEKFPSDLVKKSCELGFVGGFIPETYGGPGAGWLADCLINEEFWRVDPGLGKCCQVTVFGAEMILLFGTEEQKHKWLPPLVQGKMISGCAITEPNAGSDPCSGSTRAIREGDEYVISGNKRFITNGTIADLILVYCITEPEAKDIHDRYSFIAVETNRKGYKAEKQKHKLGIRACDTADIIFDEVRVPKENLIGKAGQGFRQFMHFLNHTRLHICGEAVGLAQGALDQAIKYVQMREQFGKPLAFFQVTQFKIAEMATRVEASRNLYMKAAWLVDNGMIEPHLISMAKWYSGETATYVAQESLQLHGGYGFVGEYDIERFFRASKIVEIYEGTKEVQKMVIARKILGKY